MFGIWQQVLQDMAARGSLLPKVFQQHLGLAPEQVAVLAATELRLVLQTLGASLVLLLEIRKDLAQGSDLVPHHSILLDQRLPYEALDVAHLRTVELPLDGVP
jgi:hypothetical protein